MYDPFAMRVMHPHGGEMRVMRLTRESHDPAASDPEREWIKNGRVYEYDCGEKIVIMPEHVPSAPSAS